MKHVKKFLVTLVAVMAIGAVGANGAQAATGSGHINTDIGSCDFLYDYTAFAADTAHSPAYNQFSTLSNFRPNPAGTCDADDFNATLHYHYNTTTNAAQASGTISVPGLFGDCSYTGTINGTGNASSFANSAAQTFNYSGGFLCPSTVTVQTGTTLTF